MILLIYFFTAEKQVENVFFRERLLYMRNTFLLQHAFGCDTNIALPRCGECFSLRLKKSPHECGYYERPLPGLKNARMYAGTTNTPSVDKKTPGSHRERRRGEKFKINITAVWRWARYPSKSSELILHHPVPWPSANAPDFHD